MYKNNKILAIIPARGGSKGIKDKNIVNIEGKPLIAYTIEAARKSKYIDYIYVSTDSERIKDVALSYGAEVPFMRDEALASDTARTIDAICFSLDEFKKRNMNFDYLILLQPTSPLRDYEDIDKSIETLFDSNYESLASVSEVEDNPILIRSVSDNGKLESLLGINSTVRRQDFKKYYRVNGAIYINKVDSINPSTSFNDNELGFIMDQDHSLDIDSYRDLDYLRIILKEKQEMERSDDKGIKHIWH